MRRLGVLLVSVFFLLNSAFAVTTGESEIAKRFSQAQELVNQGKAEEAIQAYQSIINTNPNIPEAYNNLAALYLKQKKIKQAKSILEQGLIAHKGYGALYEGLSAINIALAKEAYSKALQIDLKPDDITIANLALSEKSLSQYKSALVVPTASAKVKQPERKTTAAGKDLSGKVNDPVVKQSGQHEIEMLLQAWSAAWSAQAVDIYLSFYHQQYLPANNTSRRAWEKSRQLRLKKPKWIKISLSDIEVKAHSDSQAVVNFKQTYKSNSFSDVSIKQMVLYNTDNGWQIFREKSL